ncbi:MAG: acyltransferase family protein [Alphaproteobacteria bacterium]|nr:acyltransferase family protein [Alphaproteobacteria bacterium]
MATTDDTSFVTLDGVRGYGALIVVFAHSMVFYAGLTSAQPHGPFVVDTFFMLSGFVIAYAYEPRLHRGMSRTTFMLQRLVRLYPLYLLGILFGVVVYFSGLGGPEVQELPGRLIQLVPQLLFLPAPDFFNENHVYPLDFPAWSMFFELFINLVYILAWPILKKTYAVVIAVGIGIAGLFVTTYFYGSLDTGPHWSTFWGGFSRVGFGFFAGVLLFRLAGSPTKPVMRTGWLWAIPWLLMPVLIFVPATPQTRPIIDIALSVLFAPLLTWTSMKLKPPKALIPLFTYGGAISYAIYVLHFPMFEVARHVAWRLETVSAIGTAAAGVAFIAVVVVVSMAAERYFDVPVRRWLNKKLKGKRPATTPRSVAPQRTQAG